MQYRTLGRTGVQVSTLALGAMNFGAIGRTTQDEATALVDSALEGGINLVDTADAYSAGESEEMVGRAIAGRRDDLVLATKAFLPMGEERNHRGSSRRWLVAELDASLRRLGVDHVDLYQVHRWDPTTGDEETLSALTDLQRAGKIRYFGSSTFPAHRIVAAQWAAREHHLGRYVTEQPGYSILQRDVESHVLPVTQEHGMGVLVWSPLASGWLSGAIRAGREITTSRSTLMPARFDPDVPANQAKMAAVEQLAVVAERAGLTDDPARARLRHRAPGRDQRDHRPPHTRAPGLPARGRRHGAPRRRARRHRLDRPARGRPRAGGEGGHPAVPARPDAAATLMAPTTRPSFGIMTAPQQVAYADIRRVWREADSIAEIEHAWLFDHLLPIGGDPTGPIFEGWTLLSALAAQTERLRLGLLVTSNRFRPPAVLAKIAATVDVVSGGRLVFGIGAGSRPGAPVARREYEAHGLPFHDAAHAVGALAEAVAVIRRLWTDDEPFDVDGTYVRLTGALCNPKPVQRPHPPIAIGGGASTTLRVVAEHADVWNFQGGDMADGVRRSARLDEFCAEIGRDPATITRSTNVPASYDDPAATREAIGEALDAGFTHIVLMLPAPYPGHVARWVADELIAPFLTAAG